MKDMASERVETLPHYMCLFVDTPTSGQSCSEVDPSICVECRVPSPYLWGESIDDFTSPGYGVCVLLWVGCVAVGVLGVLGNLLVIAVLNRRGGSNKGFDFLLKVLAWFDLLCCIGGGVASSSHVSFFGNWSGRGGVLLTFCNYSWILLQFCRSATQYLAVTLTIERFMVITFPFQCQYWFSVLKSRIIAVFAVVFAVLLSLPRSTSRYTGENGYRHDKLNVPMLRNLDYYLMPTKLNKFWYEHLGSVHYQLDFWGPLPILLVFNFLSYLQVRKLSKKRKELRISQKRNIQAVKMFLPVVLVLVLLNLVPIAQFILVRFWKVLYREVFFSTILSITLNSAVNFLIYYLRAGAFRTETKVVLAPYLGKVFPQLAPDPRGFHSHNESSVTKDSSIQMSCRVVEPSPRGPKVREQQV